MLETLRADFTGWWIWFSERTGFFHAIRADDRFTVTEGDPRRFHLAATTAGRLAVQLLAQAVLDAGPMRNEVDQMERDTVASWSAHHIPAGTPIRYVVSATDDDAPIRLLFGTSDQLELEMPLSVIDPVIETLRKAEAEVRERQPG